MKDLLAQQLEAFVKTLKAKRPEWDLIGDASVTARQAGLQRLHELLLEVFERPSVEAVQKVLRLQWPELKIALEAAGDLGWTHPRSLRPGRPLAGVRATKWTLQAEATLYRPGGGRAVRGRVDPTIGLRRVTSRGLRAEFTLDVRIGSRGPPHDLYDIYLSWPADQAITLPAALARRVAARASMAGPAWAQPDLWAAGPVQLDDVLDDEARDDDWRPGQTHELGILCSHNHNCPYNWTSMLTLYQHAPFWFDVLHAVIAQTDVIVG